MTAAKVSPDPIAIDAPEGFLCEWWSVFWDIFISRTNDKHSESASAYIQALQTKAREQLDVHIHDYLVKRKLYNSAKSFMTAAKVSPDPIAIDAPKGFLCEWWSVFWDIFISRTNDKHSESASAYIQALQTKAREQQLQMQKLQLMRHCNAQLKRRHPNHSALGDSINGVNSKGMTHSNSMDSRASPTLIYANRVVLPKSTTSHQGQLVHGNSGNMSTALEQIQAQASGINQGNTSLPLKGSPLTGIDQLRPSLGGQVQKPNLTNQNQSLLASQQQQALAQAQAQNNLGKYTKCDIDPHRLADIGRGSMSAKDGQAARNDESTLQVQQTKARKRQHQLQLMRHHSTQLKRRHPNHSAPGDSINGMNSKGMTHSNSMHSGASPTLIYANRVVLPKSATSHRGQLVHGNSGNISTALEKNQVRPSGLNQGNTSIPREGSPLTGIDQLRPSLGVQVHKPDLTNQKESLLVSQQQEALAQAQAQNNLGNSTECDMDQHRLSDLGRGSLSAKDGQAARNDRSTLQAQQTKAREQQLQMQPMRHRSAQLKRRHPNHSALGDSINGTNSKGMTHSNSMDSGASPTLIYANRAALPKSTTNHQGQLVHGNSRNMSTALEQIQAQPFGLNQGNKSLPLKGSPLTEIDQLRPSLGVQVQKPNLTNQNQSLLVSQQQQALAQAQNNLGNSTKCDMDPRRLSDLGRGSLSSKDGQAARNDRSICTQVLSGSPKMKMAQAQHSLSQQQEPLQQNNIKRKQHSSSGSANSTGTGNAVDPSPNSPPSTPTPRDGIDTTSSMQHVDSVQVSMMMNGIEGTGSLASSPLSLDHLELYGDFDFFDKQFGDIDTLGFDVESFLLNDGEDSGNLYGTIEQCHPAEQQKETSKGSS